MGKSLVVVESPTKVRTISRILGDDFIVKSSVGHIRDLPLKSLGVDVKNGFEPQYVVAAGKKKVIDELKKAAKSCETVYLAPDPDREGEAIAWHLQAVLETTRGERKFFRVRYNEITARAVREAFEHPGEINRHLVDAQQARRVLDRLVGYTVSPMLWRRVRRGLSAGRVQSVALRLVCEREKEILGFVPEAYWIIGAQVRKFVDPRTPFRIKLMRINDEKADVGTPEQAGRVRADLEGRALRVSHIATKTISKRPAPPYITSTLQQAGSNYGGFSPQRTMAIAQRLYEGVDVAEGSVGLITYMRTDSVNVSREAVAACRAFITEQIGPEFCPETPPVYRSRGGAQEAHEAIRPTDVTRTPESLKDRLEAADLKLYTLIWKRFVASQMKPAELAIRTVQIEAVPPSAQALPPSAEANRYVFHATASEVTFPGYMRISGREALKSDGDDEAGTLPPLQEGESIECLEWTDERKETQPPPRYSEASLIRALENNGVGRPSTYAQTAATLHQRAYVRREKRTLFPTELGMKVNDMLVGDLDELFNVAFTASMETSLDEIEKGSIEWTRMLADFYAKFSEWMAKAREPEADRGGLTRILTALAEIQDWAPEVKRGKRTYSDRKFVESVGDQLTRGEKPVSQRQMDALLKIACHYRQQVPGLEAVVRELGYEKMLEDPGLEPPSEIVERKLEMLRGLELNESTRSFVDSLASRVASRRSLTAAQLKALNNMVMRHGTKLEGFDQMRAGLELEDSEVENDTESRPLLESAGKIREWRAPTTRGKRVFNDEAFFKSLSEHFERKGFLSPRQRAALKKMLERYNAQIPDYPDLAQRYGLRERRGDDAEQE